MDRILVSSTDISSIGYDADKHQIHIEFKRSPGKVYLYDDVPAQVYRSFVMAHSPGKFFHENIKGKYVFTTYQEAKS